VVVDTSAILAVLFVEQDQFIFAEALAGHGRKFITPLNALEADIVVQARKGDDGKKNLDLFFYHSGLDIIPFDKGMHQLAFEAWKQYGKGRHPASLNMGDCCAYALAKYLNEPLLFKGDDFTKTDIKPAVPFS
jgi:ribonuclease VapC